MELLFLLPNAVSGTERTETLMILTIAIPTYNRNKILSRNIKLLLPQLTSECKLLVLDNHSDVPVEETLMPVIKEYPEINIRLIRNRVNIGGNGNIVRCYEYCDTDYLWVLGDDDMVEPDAIRTILEKIKSYPEAIYFNYNFYELIPDRNYKKEPFKKNCAMAITKGFDDFMDHVSSFGQIVFISSGIFKVPKMLPFLYIGMNYQYSSFPHLVMLLCSLETEEICCFADDFVVTNGHLTTPSSLKGFTFGASLAWGTLLDIPINFNSRKRVKKILEEWASPFTAIGRAVLLVAVYGYDPKEIREMYGKIYHRLLCLYKGKRFQGWLFGFLLFSPNISLRLMQLVYRIVKRKPLNIEGVGSRPGL